MEKQLEKLSHEDKALLLRAPALVSLLAACSDGGIDRREKADAIELSHLRTFTSPPILHPYYKEVEKIFEEELEKMIQQYCPMGELQEQALKEEVEKVYEVLDQLDQNFRLELWISLDSYARHVGSVHQHFLEFFVFPLSIRGITE